MKRLDSKLLPFVLAGLQILGISALLVTQPLEYISTIVLIVSISGIFLGIWSLWTMRKSRLNILPDIRKGAVLVTSGPYYLIRHPMYTSLLLTFIPLFLNHPTGFRLGALIVLISALVGKIRYEEPLLRNHFPEYQSYTRRTWKMIPWVY